MITLFEPNETNFTHNGLGSLDKNIIDPVVEEDLNGLFSLSFRYPLFALHGLEIDGQSIVRSPVPNGPDQLFRVYKPVKSMGYLEVFCYHIFYDLVDNFIEDTNIVGKNGQEALTQLGSRTQYAHNFRFFSDITTIAGSRVVRKNPVSFLLDDNLDNSFVNRWGGELKRDNFDVFMYNAIGSDKGVTIRHKKDLLGYEAVVDWSTVVTRIMPIGFDGLLLPEKYVDSPVINSYVKPKIQIIEYSDVKAAVGQYADDKDAIPIEQAYKELRKLAKLEYEKGKIDYPEASYKVEFATLSETEEYKDYKELETVRLGDTVTVNHDEDNLHIKAKVIHYRFNPLTKKYINIELGNYRETFSDLQGKIDSIYNRVEEVKQDLSLTIQISANGKNTIYRGVATPVNTRVGDLWFKPIENGYEELYLYVGDPIEPWLLILSTADLDRIKKEVEKAQATADQAKQDAIKAHDDAVAEAKRLLKDTSITFTEKLNTQKEQLELNITTQYDQAVQDSIGAIYDDVDNLRAKILVADVITSTHLKVDSALITKLKVNDLLTNSLISDTIITDAMRTNALSAITANITSIRSQILVSNVVEATHLKADTAMVDKLFATTALIDTLTSKVAFVNSVKAIDISADRITAGTLNAANVNIINLNVSKIVGLNSNFVQSAWNSLNSTVSLDGNGLRTYSDNLETRIKSGSVSFYVDGDRIGSMLPLRNVKNSTKKSIGLVGETGRNVIIGRFGTNGVFPSIEVDGTTGNIGVKETLDFHVNGNIYGKIYGHSTEGLIIASDGSEIKFFQGGKSLMYGVEGGLRLYRTLNMNGNNIDRVDNIIAGTVITSLIRTDNLLTIKRGNETYVQMVSGGFRMQSMINMNTFNLENVGKLTYSSDARYKSNIKNRVVSDLDIIRNIRYVNYIFNSTGAKQRGLIAQELNAVDPSLITTSSDGYLSYDSQQYVHTIGHALQELDVNVRKLRGNALANNNILLNKIGELDEKSSMQNVTITRIDTFVTQHELEIKNLKKRIKELEEKVA